MRRPRLGQTTERKSSSPNPPTFPAALPPGVAHPSARAWAQSPPCHRCNSQLPLQRFLSKACDPPSPRPRPCSPRVTQLGSLNPASGFRWGGDGVPRARAGSPQRPALPCPSAPGSGGPSWPGKGFPPSPRRRRAASLLLSGGLQSERPWRDGRSRPRPAVASSGETRPAWAAGEEPARAAAAGEAGPS